MSDVRRRDSCWEHTQVTDVWMVPRYYDVPVDPGEGTDRGTSVGDDQVVLAVAVDSSNRWHTHQKERAGTYDGAEH